MRNNKGFTLIELLVTIVLLSVIGLISFVSINAVIKKNKTDNCNSLVSSIISATKEYFSDHRYDREFDNNIIFNFNAGYLVNGSKKYLTTPIYNPFTKEEMNPNDIRIDVSLNDDLTVRYAKIMNPEDISNCPLNLKVTGT